MVTNKSDFWRRIDMSGTDVLYCPVICLFYIYFGPGWPRPGERGGSASSLFPISNLFGLPPRRSKKRLGRPWSRVLPHETKRTATAVTDSQQNPRRTPHAGKLPSRQEKTSCGILGSTRTNRWRKCRLRIYNGRRCMWTCQFFCLYQINLCSFKLVIRFFHRTQRCSNLDPFLVKCVCRCKMVIPYVFVFPRAQVFAHSFCAAFSPTCCCQVFRWQRFDIFTLRYLPSSFHWFIHSLILFHTEMMRQ